MKEPSLAVGYRVDRVLILSKCGYKSGKSGHRRLWYNVRCDCGVEFEASNSGLMGITTGRRRNAECRKCSAARYRNAKLGQVFGNLIVSGFTETKPCRAICLCICGNTCYKVIRNLEYSASANCGCIDGRISSQARVGSKFGSLTITEILKIPKSKNKTAYAYKANCTCDCGRTTVLSIGHLVNKKENSGCVACSRETPDKWVATMNTARSQGTRTRPYINWTLTVDQYKLIATSNCHYCGEIPKNNGRYFTLNGIDRVDNSAGYVDGNCVPCCSLCNRAKGKYTVEFFQNWIKKAYHYQNDHISKFP